METTEARRLKQSFGQIRRHIRQLTWQFGIASTTLAAVGTALLIGLLDWLIRWDDAGTRWLMLLVWLLPTGWVAWRWLYRPLQEPLTDDTLAARLERANTHWAGRLVSSAAFAAQFPPEHISPDQFSPVSGRPDHAMDQAGSTALAAVVVRDVSAELIRLPADQYLNARPTQRRLAWGAGCLTLALVLGLAFPAEAATALVRLFAPWTGSPWPRRVQLELSKTDFSSLTFPPSQQEQESAWRLPRGETLELYAFNCRGALPPKVVLETRSTCQTSTAGMAAAPAPAVTSAPPPAQASIATQVLRQTTLRDDEGTPREVALVQLQAAAESYEFRITGGDDDTMPWRRVDVVSPATVEQLQLRLTPPAYTNLPVESFPAGVGHVEGLVGSLVTVTLQITRPVAKGELQLSTGSPLPLTFAPDGLSARVEFPISHPGPGSYWFRLRDADGVEETHPPRYELRGMTDAIPEVAIELPATDLRVTPAATIDIKASAQDDLALAELRLRIASFRDSPEQLVPLWVAPQAAVSVAQEPPDPAPPNVTRHAIDYRWNLSALALNPGDVLTFRAEGTDHYNLGAPHVGRSVPRTLTVVTPEEKQRELSEAAGELVADVQDAASRQAQLTQQTSDLSTQLQTAGTFRPAEIDALRRLELDQQQLATRLGSPTEGLIQRSRRLRSELTDNSVASPETSQQLEELERELDTIRRDNLMTAQQALTRAQKQATDLTSATASPPEQISPNVSAPLQTSLIEAYTAEQQALGRLESLADRLDDWQNQQRAQRELQGLVGEVARLQQQTSALAAETGSRSQAQLSPQQQAELAKLAERQRRLGSVLNRTGKNLSRAADELSTRDPEQAAKLQTAADELSQRGVATRLNTAAEATDDNRLGTALSEQQAVQEDLQQTLRSLSQRTDSDTETLIKRTTTAQRQAEETLQKVRQLTAELGPDQDTAGDQQAAQEAITEAEALLTPLERQLQRLRLRGAERAAEAALARLSRVRQQLQNPSPTGDSPAPAQLNEARREAAEAVADLEQLSQELTATQQELQEELAREQLEKARDLLPPLIERQKSVASETQRLTTEQQSRGTLSRAQLKSLRDLSGVQEAIQRELSDLAERVAAAEVVALALRFSARTAEGCVRQLAARELTPRLTADTNQIVAHLTALQALLAEDTTPSQQLAPPQPAKGEPAENTPQPANAGPETERLVSQLGQIKLLRLLQQQVLEETRLLASESSSTAAGSNEPGSPPPDTARQAALQELSRRQTELSDLAGRIARQVFPPATPSAEPTPPAEPNAHAEPESPAPGETGDSRETEAATPAAGPTPPVPSAEDLLQKELES